MSDEDRDRREIGPEMKADGWIPLYDDSVMWLHQPSLRVVTVDGPVPRQRKNYDCLAIPTYRGEPADPETEGYIVRCHVADENGNPVSGHAFWVESYGEALRHGRRIRAEILAEQEAKRIVDPGQLTLDDVRR